MGGKGPETKWYDSYRDPESGKRRTVCLHTADKQAAKIRLTAALAASPELEPPAAAAKVG